MNNNRGVLGIGFLLVVAGLLLLLQNLGVFGQVLTHAVWVLLFGLGGLAFLVVFILNHEQWWALIPGMTLLGLAILIGFGERLGAWGAALFLACIGLSFWLIFATRPDYWWAIIPGGSLFSVAALVALEEGAKVNDEVMVGVMFLGLALTCALVYLLPGVQEERRWALIPAGILAVMGVLMMLTLGGLINYAWPLALIIGGGLLLWRALRMRGSA